MAKYNTIDSAKLDRFIMAADDVSRAIALCMPSVSEGGIRAKSGKLVSGDQAAYHALALSWGQGDVTQGCSDIVWGTVQCTAHPDKTSGPSNKANHLNWLTQAGLIKVDRRNGQRFSRLTDTGVAQVKAVGGNELAKLAKAFTTAAYDKAHKALAKAAQPVKASKPRKAKAVEVEPISDQQVEFSGITDNVADMIGNVADNA